MKRLIVYWIPVFVYMMAVFYISSLTSSEIPGSGGIDLSFLHIGEYFILSLLIFRALGYYKIDKKKRILLSILLSFLYGITDEIHQIYIPGRTFDFLDMIFNLVGSSLILYKTRSRK